MYGLNIHLISFNLCTDNFHANDDIRVSITTIPEEKKQAFIINAHEIHDVHHFFTINITDKTEKIVFVFRRKSLIHCDPIIASTVVTNDHFPLKKSESTNTELKQFNIFEPIKNNDPNQNRKVLGRMIIQFSLNEPFYEKSMDTKINYNITRIHKGEGYSKVFSFDNANENEFRDNSLFSNNFDLIN